MGNAHFQWHGNDVLSLVCSLLSSSNFYHAVLDETSGSHGCEHEHGCLLVRREVWRKFTDFSEVLADCILRAITLKIE
jgi:hypothetical protein